MRIPIRIPVLAAAVLLATAAHCATTSRDLRLVPFPKQVRLNLGEMTIGRRMLISVTDTPVARQAASDLRADLTALGCTDSGIRTLPASVEEPLFVLSAIDTGPTRARKALGAIPERSEGYRLVATPGLAVVGGHDAAGLVWGIQALRQLVRANCSGSAIPCLEITDWPSLRYRGFQDDITRGPSPRLSALRREVAAGAYLRMNLFTYYLEHQFDFRKHPVIGPAGGSLRPEELRALVAHARDFGVEIVGCQQSFGHFWHILKHDEYVHLRETADILNPTLEDSYSLLDDLYSKQMPCLESKLFNVCCDETWGLGTGPSKPLAEQIGVGGVYARHMKRVYDLVTGKYGKRMMMWGDIIIQHPENLAEIPMDTIMLSWGYHAAESFEPAIIPFARSGFEFFVCPGTNCWGWMLPDFSTAVTNIRNYVRDGARHGALGMLNTTWVDDGETLFPYNWHGIAWGAECAWNASATSIEDFSRRIGGVLFGEPGDHFGRAIELLSRAHSLPGYNALFDTRFWQCDGGDFPDTREARGMLAVVEPALTHLRQARAEARSNRDLLDYFIFAAERIKLMATRHIDFLEAAEAYAEAASTRDRSLAMKRLAYCIDTLSSVRDQHAQSRERYRELWLREKKPYALDWTTARFDTLIKRYDDLVRAVEEARGIFAPGGSLPPPAKLGLAIHEPGGRRTSADAVETAPLLPDATWSQPRFTRRIGITVSAGDVARSGVPMEVDLPAEAGASADCVLVEVGALGTQTALPCQIDRLGKVRRLSFFVPGDFPAGTQRSFLFYFSPDKRPEAASVAAVVEVKDALDGMKWITNDLVRLLIGPEGGHIYRWEIRELADLDITEPGEKDWAGFADINGVYRNPRNRIEIVSRGPVLARVRCIDPSGWVKTFSLWAGMPWVEVTLSSPSAWLACYDDIRVMGADGPTRGTYLFSDGDTGPIRKLTAGLDCQTRRTGVHWSAKYVRGGPLIAMITPEVAAGHYVGPGSGMGAVGIDSGSAAHFVIYGGRCPESPKQVLDTLWRTLDYRAQPSVTLHSVQASGSSG